MPMELESAQVGTRVRVQVDYRDPQRRGAVGTIQKRYGVAEYLALRFCLLMGRRSCSGITSSKKPRRQLCGRNCGGVSGSPHSPRCASDQATVALIHRECEKRSSRKLKGIEARLEAPLLWHPLALAPGKALGCSRQPLPLRPPKSKRGSQKHSLAKPSS